MDIFTYACFWTKFLRYVSIFLTEEVIAKVHQNSHRKQLVVVLRSTFASRVDREFSLLWEWGVLRWKGEPETLLDPHPWERIQSWVCDGSTWRELENHITCTYSKFQFSLWIIIIQREIMWNRIVEEIHINLNRTKNNQRDSNNYSKLQWNNFHKEFMWNRI